MAYPITIMANPAGLRLPESRLAGADFLKLARQISRFGNSIAGIPEILVLRCSDEELKIMDGVTRATRVAKLLPGLLIPVTIIGSTRKAGTSLPKVSDRI